MFIAALIIAIIIGYILKGRLKNIDTSRIKAVYLVFISFLIEAVVNFSMRGGLLSRGTITFIMDLIMYILLFSFIYLNRNNKWIVLMGIGFLLNAIPIFLNGGAMPVSSAAIKAMGFTGDITTQGLYTLIESNTRIPFLGDIIFLKYPRPYAISIGDCVEAIGLMLFIVIGMKTKKRARIINSF